MNAVRESAVGFTKLAQPAPPVPAASSAAEPTIEASVADLPELESQVIEKAAGSMDHLLDVSVSVSAELGRAEMTIGDILKLDLGSVIGLDRTVAEPVELLVQGVPFARGEVVVIDNCFAIRIREILDPKVAVKR